MYHDLAQQAEYKSSKGDREQSFSVDSLCPGRAHHGGGFPSRRMHLCRPPFGYDQTSPPSS